MATPAAVTEKELIHYRAEKGITFIEMDDPPANTYTYAMMRQLGGEPLSEEKYKQHLEEVLPNEDDVALLAQIFEEGKWVEEKKATTRAQ